MFKILVTVSLVALSAPAIADTFNVMEMTCALGVAPRECSPHYGAVDVAKIGEASLPIECLRWGLLSGPSTPSAADGNSYYHKIMCVRQ